MSECPKCGSDNGWQYIYRARVYQMGPWGEPQLDSVIEAENLPKTASCLDCGARVDRDEVDRP